MLKWAKWQAQLGRTILAPCFFNFNRDTLASGKTRMAPKTSESAAMWCLHRTGNTCHWPCKATFAVKIWAQMRQFWHLALATSTMTPLRVARLGWLPRPANLSLLGGWLRTRKICHWPWNAKSTRRKAKPSPTQHKPGSPWENWWLPITSQLHFSPPHNSHLGPI